MLPRVALAITVRDEARLLRAHLEYHRFLGVERAYVYLDEEGDTTRRTIADLDYAEIHRCADPAPYRGHPVLERFVETWTRHLAARQSLNVVDAMARAESAGCDWLLSIDADELACPDRDALGSGALAAALGRVSGGIDTAWLPNLEVAQRPHVDGLVFREARRFKRPGAFRRPILDPRTGRVVCRSCFYGHSSGKSAARVGRGAVPISSHRFCRDDGAPLAATEVGELLHYYAYDFEDWLRRSRNYRDHDVRHVSGVPVEPQKLLWIELAGERGLDRDALRAYFDAHVALGDEEIARLSRRSWRAPWRRPGVVEVAAVADAFTREPLASY